MVTHPRRLRAHVLATAVVLVAGLVGLARCGAEGPVGPGGPGPVAAPGETAATAGDVRFSLPTAHRVVVERRTGDGWGDPRVVLDDGGRECGRVHAIAAGPTVAATVDCDDHFAEDQAPTRSVALVSSDGRSWEHHDLEGEASGSPGLAPGGARAVWVQDGGLLTWAAGSFGTAPAPAGDAQVVTVDDDGTVRGLRPGTAGGRCTVKVRSEEPGAEPVVVPVGPAATGPGAGRRALTCSELGLTLTTPREVRGDVSGQPGTAFVVRRTGAAGWALAARPPITAPGLVTYPDDPRRAVWNELTSTTRGALVAVGSPDRRRVTAQRYDRDRQRWTAPRVVHDAGAPTCRRRVGDAGLLQGSTLRLRLVCDGGPVLLSSRTGASWRVSTPGR